MDKLKEFHKTAARHRNGVSGLGFYVKVEDNTLMVQFDNQDEDKKTNDVIKVPLVIFEEFVKASLKGKPYHDDNGDKWQYRTHAGLSDAVDLFAYDMSGETFVGVHQHGLEEVPFAAFQWDLLKQGECRFMVNSWRGDTAYNNLCRQALATEEEDKLPKMRITTISIKYGDGSVGDMVADILCKPEELQFEIDNWLLDQREKRDSSITIQGFSSEYPV
jgi:hypothetical protein